MEVTVHWEDLTLERLYWEVNWTDNWEECTNVCTEKSIWRGLYIGKTLYSEDCTGKTILGKMEQGRLYLE